MNKLNDDMQRALDSMRLTNTDKKFIEELLYQERVNKTKEWTSDAVRSIKELLDTVNTDNPDDQA